MGAPTIVSDGTTAYGTQLLSINGASYIADDFRVARPKEIAEDRTQAGAAQHWRATEGFGTGSATLQAPSGTAYPKFGDTFTITVDTNYGAELFAIMEVQIEQNNEATAMRKLPVTFRKVLSGAVTTVA